MMKNVFYSTVKTPFAQKTFKFLFWLFWSRRKTAWRLYKKTKVDYKIYYDVTNWKTEIQYTYGRISQSTVWNFIQFVFIFCRSWGLAKHIETKVRTTCFYLIKSLVWGLKLVSQSNFLHHIWRKIVLTLYSIDYLFTFTSSGIVQYVNCNYLFSGLWHYKFWNHS